MVSGTRLYGCIWDSNDPECSYTQVHLSCIIPSRGRAQVYKLLCGCQVVQFSPVHLYTCTLVLHWMLEGGCTGVQVVLWVSAGPVCTCTPVHWSCIGCWRGGVQVYRLFCGCQLVQFAPVHLYTCTLVLHWMLEGGCTGVQVVLWVSAGPVCTCTPVHLYTCLALDVGGGCTGVQVVLWVSAGPVCTCTPVHLYTCFDFTVPHNDKYETAYNGIFHYVLKDNKIAPTRRVSKCKA
jgi:hypothetical protein